MLVFFNSSNIKSGEPNPEKVGVDAAERGGIERLGMGDVTVDIVLRGADIGEIGYL